MTIYRSYMLDGNGNLVEKQTVQEQYHRGFASFSIDNPKTGAGEGKVLALSDIPKEPVQDESVGWIRTIKGLKKRLKLRAAADKKAREKAIADGPCFVPSYECPPIKAGDLKNFKSFCGGSKKAKGKEWEAAKAIVSGSSTPAYTQVKRSVSPVITPYTPIEKTFDVGPTSQEKQLTLLKSLRVLEIAITHGGAVRSALVEYDWLKDTRQIFRVKESLRVGSQFTGSAMQIAAINEDSIVVETRKGSSASPISARVPLYNPQLHSGDSALTGPYIQEATEMLLRTIKVLDIAPREVFGTQRTTAKVVYDQPSGFTKEKRDQWDEIVWAGMEFSLTCGNVRVKEVDEDGILIEAGFLESPKEGKSAIRTYVYVLDTKGDN